MAELRDKLSQHYTYDDYSKWDDDKRYELIDGIPYAMSAPTVRHQRISGELFGQFWNYLKGKQCEVFAAPFDVRLNADKEDDTVVQPDLVVICDKSKLDEKGCKGAPDLVVEILSPSTASKDKILKLNKYQEVGVKEYWIVDPERNLVDVLTLRDGFYAIKTYGEEDVIPVGILKDCEINLKEVFEGT